MIICFASLSASYSHWEEKLQIYADMETTEWGEKSLEIRIAAFEDLPIGETGTGTQGYWKNHPEDWPVETITIGGITYTKTEAIDIMNNPGPGDKTYDMYSQLVAAKLNVIIGCESSCIDQTIIDADNWMATYGPVGSGVGASDPAWQNPGSSLHTTLTNYNEGEMCAPHRDDVEETNDWDYNDFIVDLNMTGYYIDNDPILVQLNLIFEAMARGAAYHHDYSFFLPPGFFGCNSTAVIDYYETDGTHISTNTINYEDEDPILITIFSNTWTALPPIAGHPWATNAVDGTGIHPGRITTVEFTFEGFFCVNELNLDDYTLDYVGVHGHNLFFDTPLHVWDTGEIIHKGDDRYLITPNNWEWPQEYAPIWDVYPYNPVTEEGVYEARSPPVFTQHWYTETPTTWKWDP